MTGVARSSHEGLAHERSTAGAATSVLSEPSNGQCMMRLGFVIGSVVK